MIKYIIILKKEENKMENKELRLARLYTRRELLLSRNRDNRRIVSKIEREIRKLEV